MKNGDLYLYFSNEFPYGQTNEKEISLLVSKDKGETWGEPERIVFKKGKRSASPMPFFLANDNYLVSFMQEPEEKNLSRGKPFIAQFEGKEKVSQWSPFIRDMDGEDEGTAPFIAQIPTGETLLALQVKDEGDSSAHMKVFIGSKDAKHFTHVSEPFGNSGKPVVCPSIYVQGDTKITAIASTEIDGTKGIWLIDGTVIRR